MKRIVKILRKDGTVKNVKINGKSLNSEKITIDGVDYFPSSHSIFDEPSGIFHTSKKLIILLEGSPEPVGWKNPDYSINTILQSKVDSDLLNPQKEDKAKLILFAIIGAVMGLMIGFILGHDVFIQTATYKVVRQIATVISLYIR